MSEIPNLNTDIAGTVADFLRRNALYFRDEPALLFEGTTRTHGELVDRGTKLANAFYALGLRRQERVAVLATNCLEFCEIYAAVELSAYVAAAVNYRLAAAEIAATLNDASPKILVFEDRYADVIDQIRPQLATIEHYICIGKAPGWAAQYETIVEGGRDDTVPYRPQPMDLCYLLYTGGSTGRPKGVMVSQAAAVGFAELIALSTQAGPSDRCLLMMPLCHSGAKNMQLAFLKQSSAVTILPGFDAENVLSVINDQRISITHMAPSLIRQVLDHPSVSKYDLRSLRAICYSAAPMPIPVLKQGLELLGPVFLQMYGQTEGSGTVLPAQLHRPDGSERDLRRLGSIGIPGANVSVRIVDDEDRDVPVGQPGEILLRHASVMAGYWNNSAATAETLRGGWLHTGDMAKFDEDGFLYLVDRKKDMIISGGENVYSREVENALYQHPAIAEAVVIGIPDPKWGEAVHAVVALKPGGSTTEDELVAHCRTLIAGYKRPRSIDFLDELPKMPTGKIDKVAVRNKYGRRG